MAERRLPAVQWMSTPAAGWSSSTRAAKHAAAAHAPLYGLVSRSGDA